LESILLKKKKRKTQTQKWRADFLLDNLKELSVSFLGENATKITFKKLLLFSIKFLFVIKDFFHSLILKIVPSFLKILRIKNILNIISFSKNSLIFVSKN